MRKFAFRKFKVHKQKVKRIACIMKLSVFFLLLCLQISAAGLTQKITLDVRGEKLGKVFKLIEAQTAYKFVYSNSIVPVNKQVSIQAHQKELADVLRELLNNFGLDYREEGGRFLVIFQEGNVVPKVVIRGRITNAAGEPLQGVSIVVKANPSIGTTTDENGNFSITVPGNGSVLMISYLGFRSQEVTVDDSATYNIRLDVNNGADLSEVVVVGYGTQRKRDITGATSTVRAAEITQVPVMSPEYALQGRASGVQVLQTNGAPGGAVQVRIRGVNGISPTGNQPLYVVDGVPLFDAPGEQVAGAGGNGTPDNNTSSPLSTINPNDIESMEVLKDASATAIYGSRAANGVVLITTKSGKAGKTVFNFDYYYGIQNMQRKWDLVNAVEGMLLRKEALLNTRSDINRNIPAEMFNPFAFATSQTYKNNDWQDVLFRTAPIQDANLSASGGTEAFRYLTSLNYFNQEGIFVNTNMKRYSARLNLDVKASSRLNFGLRTTVSNQNGNNVTDGNPFQGTVIGSLYNAQYHQTHNPDGTYWGPPHNVGGTFDSRNYLHEAMDFTRKLNRFRYNGNIWGELEIVRGLKFRSQLGVDINTLDNNRFNPAIPRGPAFIISGPDLGGNNTARSYIQQVRSYNWVADQLLTYNTTLNKVHQINAVVGFSAQQVTNRSLIGQGDGSLNPLLTLVGTNNGQNIQISEGFGQNGLVSQFVRVNYGFDNRYLFTGTVRRDGSSNFGSQNRYGIFPAVSVGWRVSEEKFMQNVDFIRDLKFRLSYGVVGNQNIGSFQFIPRMAGSNAAFGTQVVNGFTLTGIANEALQWEENEKKDIGVDLTILNGRLDVTADYFVNTSRGLLLGVPIPQFSGFGSQTVNVGLVENRGWELALNSRNLTGRFRWTTNFNISSVKNKVLDLGISPSGTGNEYFGIGLFTQGNPFGTINLTRAGWPIGSFYGLRTDGIFRTNTEAAAYPTLPGHRTMAGDMRYIDENKDGVIDEKDRVYLGSPFPNLFGGFSNEFSYKNLSLNVLANFVLGQKMFNYARMRLESFGDPWGGAAHLQRWSESNPNTGYPRMTLGNISGYNRINSDRWIDDASFLRIRNIMLAYQVQGSLLKRARLQSLRFYVSTSNAFTITRYKGWDPEAMSSGSNVLSGGIDQGTYPVARTFQFGVNCRF